MLRDTVSVLAMLISAVSAMAATVIPIRLTRGLLEIMQACLRT
jgi:hypothetical protein